MVKAIAIPYVIALIFGIIIVGIIGYWFISQGGKTVGAGAAAECQSKLFLYCKTLKEGNPNTDLWDQKCNDMFKITAPRMYPSIDDCK